MRTAFIIPAIKKNVVFIDDVIKKLAGVPLIVRTIRNVKRNVRAEDIFILTDSEEVALITRRENVNAIFKANYRLAGDRLLNTAELAVTNISEDYESICVVNPYCPEIPPMDIRKAHELLEQTHASIVVPTSKKTTRYCRTEDEVFKNLFLPSQPMSLWARSSAFLFLDRRVVLGAAQFASKDIVGYRLANPIREILSQEDWWVFEKLYYRKRILLRVVGDQEVGMGHVLRALSIAHEITDHEVIFVTDTESTVAAKTITDCGYSLLAVHRDRIFETIISLSPNLLINDILNTNRNEIEGYQNAGIKVVNFEDVGTGGLAADLTFNAVFTTPLFEAEHVKWGPEYFILRDEFNNASQNAFQEDISSMMVTFGGTDPADLTRLSLNGIVDVCRDRNIHLDIVTGSGYPHKKALEKEIAGISDVSVYYTHATGVMSSIMENVQLAITGNGRTVYELAHMRIPSLVLCQNQRERTHDFAQKSNGFHRLVDPFSINLQNNLCSNLRGMIDDVDYRRRLYHNTARHDFSRNKSNILTLIDQVLH